MQPIAVPSPMSRLPVADRDVTFGAARDGVEMKKSPQKLVASVLPARPMRRLPVAEVLTRFDGFSTSTTMAGAVRFWLSPALGLSTAPIFLTSKYLRNPPLPLIGSDPMEVPAPLACCWRAASPKDGN